MVYLSGSLTLNGLGPWIKKKRGKKKKKKNWIERIARKEARFRFAKVECVGLKFRDGLSRLKDVTVD